MYLFYIHNRVLNEFRFTIPWHFSSHGSLSSQYFVSSQILSDKKKKKMMVIAYKYVNLFMVKKLYKPSNFKYFCIYFHNNIIKYSRSQALRSSFDHNSKKPPLIWFKRKQQYKKYIKLILFDGSETWLLSSTPVISLRAMTHSLNTSVIILKCMYPPTSIIEVNKCIYILY